MGRGAPLGNKYGRGKKGRSGRKSSFQEMADAQELYKMFFSDQDVEKLQEKIKTRKFSVKTLMMMKALAGNERDRIEMFKKVFPDNLNIQGQVNSEELKLLSNDIRSILEKGAKKIQKK